MSSAVHSLQRCSPLPGGQRNGCRGFFPGAAPSLVASLHNLLLSGRAHGGGSGAHHSTSAPVAPYADCHVEGAAAYSDGQLTICGAA